jgi:hypothetical protein
VDKILSGPLGLERMNPVANSTMPCLIQMCLLSFPVVCFRHQWSAIVSNGMLRFKWFALVSNGLLSFQSVCFRFKGIAFVTKGLLSFQTVCFRFKQFAFVSNGLLSHT